MSDLGIAQKLNSIDMNDESKFFWNYNIGNHFAILAEQNEENSEIPAGQYMIVHALQEHIDSIMRICPGKIYGQMHQLFARTKHGDFDYTKSNIMSKKLKNNARRLKTLSI